MGLYQRPDSPFWWMSVERPGQRPIQRSTKVLIHGGTVEQTKDNRALAQQVYATTLGDLARARHQLPIERPVIAFREYRAWYEQHFSRKKGGYTRERSMLKQLGRFFDDRYLHTIERDDCIEWRTDRGEEVKPRTVNREMAILCHMLGQAVPKYLEKNPAARLPELRAKEVAIRILTHDEEARLLAKCDLEEKSAVICGLDTLQRLTAVATLTWDAVTPGTIEFLNLKTLGRLSVPISHRLRRALAALERTRDPNVPWVFPSLHDSPRPGPRGGRPRRADTPEGELAASRLDERLRAVLAKAEIPVGRDSGGISFHSLRHTGATRMLRAGADPKTVMTVGGWSSLKMLEKYLHADADHLRQAVNLVSQRKPDVNNTRHLGSRRVPSRPVDDSAQVPAREGRSGRSARKSRVQAER